MRAQPSEFEEKEFEAPLYNQLEYGTNYVWAPDQVFEQDIGIDRAIFLGDPRIWHHLGITNIPRGLCINRLNWPFWQWRARRGSPTFRLNLFIQAKRSFYHTPPPKKLREKLTSRICWRFDMEHTQQEPLGSVAEAVGNRAIICYAAPAFHRFTQLNAHRINGTILQSSTFPLAASLKGHGSFYYCSPGDNGVANPELQSIEGLGLGEILRNARNDAKRFSIESRTEELQVLFQGIEVGLLEATPESNTRQPSSFNAFLIWIKYLKCSKQRDWRPESSCRLRSLLQLLTLIGMWLRFEALSTLTARKRFLLARITY